MFNAEDVRELAEFHSNDHLVSSLYFHAPHIQDLARRKSDTALKDLFRDALKRSNGISARMRESVEDDAQKMTQYLARSTDGHEGRVDHAVFACSGAGYFKGFPLRRGFSHWARSAQTSLCVAERFCVRPLVELMDLYPRMGVAVVDRERGRIMAVNIGEIEKQVSLFDEAPPRTRGSGYGGYLTNRIERHVDEEVSRHYQHVLDDLLGFYRKHRFDRLVLGGHKQAITDFKAMLPEELKRRVVGEFIVDPGVASNDLILEKAVEVQRVHEKARKEKLVHDVFDNAGPMGRGVVGLDATLGALLKREVQVLVIGDGCCAGGKSCGNCGFLGAVTLTECPSCGQKLRAVEDLVDEAVRRALLDDADVRFINDSPTLQRAGNIGAILRFRSEKKAS